MKSLARVVSALAMSASLFGCPEEKTVVGGEGGTGGSGGAGSDGGAAAGGQTADGGGQIGGASATLEEAATSNCDVQCACIACDADQQAHCMDVTTGHNAPDNADCNDEYIVYLDCMTAHWDCEMDPVAIIVTFCEEEQKAVSACDEP